MSNVSDLAQRIAETVAERIQSRRHWPAATYRLQFQPGTLTFRDAAELAAYLDELGISHLYASPCRKARSGCGHGYAIVDYGQLDPQLGSADDYRAMLDALRGRRLGQIVDIVPNHMSATAGENPWWNDVLENGPGAPHASYFDIDWRPIKEELRNRILLPILGGQYGQVLEAGELKLEYREGAFFVRYFQALLPLDPPTYRTILARGIETLKETLPPDAEDLRELESILTALEHLPPRTRTDPASVAERQREKEVIKGRLRKLVGRAPTIAEFIERNVRELNGSPEEPHSFDALDELLDAQVYRLCHWKAADDEINYRRFFDINDLAAVCTEDPQVFAESHEMVFDLLVQGDADGLRIDHIDGLYDPREYLRRLQGGYLRALGKAVYGGLGTSVPSQAEQRLEVRDQRSEVGNPKSEIPHSKSQVPNQQIADPSSLIPHPSSSPPPWSEVEPVFLSRVAELCFADRARLPLYVVAEKILAVEEPLPEDFLLAGTTGYDFLNLVNGLFVDRAGLERLIKDYGRFIDRRLDFREVAHESKVLILKTAMASDLQLLAHRLNRISERHRRSRDFTLNALRVALREIIACFPVYRTYIRRGEVSERDRQVICRASAQAKRRNPVSNAAVFDFIRDVLLLESAAEIDEPGRHEEELFVGRFQQVTSPVTAKGIEDTAFYRWIPLASLNEVGGDPARGAVGLEEFHRHNRQRQAQWPQSLLATTTHDSKRSEDVRARINVLSEIPHLWRTAVNRWARWNRRRRGEVDGEPAPSRNDEYLFYQSLVGIWPLVRPDAAALAQLTQRLQAYLEKAAREAKVRTSWINPDAEYEAAVRAFVAAALESGPKNRFLADFQAFHEQTVNWGLYAALSQTLLKLTSPGVPDLYQGQELWDFSLVDPDNRRPVDFAPRRKMLKRLERQADRSGRRLLRLARQLALDPRDPRTKLFLTWRTLQFRRRWAEVFQNGDYLPLEARGTAFEHICAFARRSAKNGTDPICRNGPQGASHKLDLSPFSPQPVAIVIAPRWFARLTPAPQGSLTPPPLGRDVWQDTRLAVEPLPGASWTNVLTGQSHSPEDGCLWVGDVLSDFPVALLSNAASQ